MTPPPLQRFSENSSNLVEVVFPKELETSRTMSKSSFPTFAFTAKIDLWVVGGAYANVTINSSKHCRQENPPAPTPPTGL